MSDEEKSEVEEMEEKFFTATVEGWWDYETIIISDSLLCSDMLYPHWSISVGGSF